MASLLGEDEDEQRGQPQLSGGAGPSPMTQPQGRAASSPMQAPQRSAMQGRGSGMVNLESFLSGNVAQQNQQKVQNLGGELQSNEQKTYDSAADPLRNATFSAHTGNARELVNNIVPQPAANAQPKNPAAHIQGSKVENGRVWVPMPGFPGQFREYDPKKDGKTGGGSMPDPEDPKPQQSTPDQGRESLAQLQAMLTQDYTGPMSVNYDANNKNAQRLNMLGSADTALNALSPASFTENLPRNQGNHWLDESLIKSDAGTMGEIGKVKTGADAFAKTTGEESAKLADKARGFKDAAKAARDKTRGDLQTYGKDLLAGIDTRIKAADTQEAADQAGNVLRDPTTGAVVTPGINQRQTNNWEAGTGANRGNISTETERGRLGQIASLLGLDDYNVAPAGEYKSGRFTTETVPGGLVAREVPEWQVLNQTKLSTTQRAKYDELRAKGYPVNEAIKIAQADNNLTVRSVK